MAKKNEVAVKENTEVVPDYIKRDSNRGNEDVGIEDLSIPRLELVQSMSPCRKRTDSAYIDGADEGMMFNNVTRELYDGPVYVVPITFKKEYIIWKSRDSGGGFKGAFESPTAAEDAIKMLLDAGETGPFEAVDTMQHFCFLIRYDEVGNVTKVEEIVLSMSRSKAKISRQWNSIIRINGGDRFSRVYKIESVMENGEKGDYYNFKVSSHGFPTKEVYEKAEETFTEINKGLRDIEVNRDVDEEDNFDPENF